jgi:hypothetical protein
MTTAMNEVAGVVAAVGAPSPRHGRITEGVLTTTETHAHLSGINLFNIVRPPRTLATFRPPPASPSPQNPPNPRGQLTRPTDIHTEHPTRATVAA